MTIPSEASNTRNHRRRHRALSLATLVMLIVSASPAFGSSAFAQPLCLGGKIWSAEAQSCVVMGEEEPEQPAPTATEPPIEVVETPVELPGGDDAQGGAEQVEADGPSTEAAMDEGRSESAALVEDGSVGLHIFTYQCPDGFAAYSSEYASLASTCAQNTPGISFNIQVNGGQGTTLTTAGAPPYIFSPDLPAGDMTIQEVVPQGYGEPIVYCYVVREGQVMREWAQYPVSGNSVQVPGLTSPDITYCGWFNVPINASGEIMVFVFGCPENYDIYTKGPDELKTDCTAQLEGTEFMLTHPTDGITHAYTSSFSMASFVNIAPGQVRLQEFMPSGYGVPVVFCQVRGPDGQTTEQYDKFNVSNNASIGLGMDQLEFVACDFFQAPGGQAVELDTSSGSQGLPIASTPIVD